MKKLNFTLLLLIFSVIAFAQPDKEFNYSDALPSDYVKVITEVDTYNEIWVGTYTGIGRYDGNTWTQELSFGSGVNNPNVFDLLEASDGSVWAALGGNGVSVYDGGVWTNYTVSDGLASNSNWSIAEDSSGNIWIGSSDAGVSVYDGSNWTVYDTGDGLPGNSVVDILTCYRGDVWLGTANGVSIYDGSNFTNINQSQGLPSNLVKKLYQDFNGNVVVATSSGLGFYNGADWEYMTMADGLPTNNILHVSQMHGGEFLFSSDIGIIHYDGTNFNTLDYNNGLPMDIVNSSFVDSQGKIWLVTPFRGLSVIDTENAYYNVRSNLNLVNDDINSLNNIDGKLWIGTDQGANMYDSEIWRTFKTSDGLGGDTVTDIAGVADTIVFATKTGLSFYYDQSFENYNSFNGLVSDTVNCVETMTDGTVLAGTYYGMMIIYPDNSMDTITVTDGLANDTIYDISNDAGNIWIATNNGLTYYDGTSFTNYYSSDLGSNHVRSLIIDDAGDLYAGTDSTLAKYSSSSWTIYPHSDAGNPIIDIADIQNSLTVLYDGVGNVESFGKSTGNFVNLPQNHKTAIANISDTWLWLGSSNGLDGNSLLTESENSFSYTQPTCPAGNDGSVNINANIDNPPYMYSIDNGETWQTGNNFSGLREGQYHLKVENGLGQYTLDSSIYIESQYIMEAVIGLDQIMCYGDNNGVVELFMDDPAYSYSWNDSGTGTLRQNLSPGIYSVTVSNGFCTLNLQNEIIEPDSIQVSANVTDVLCFGDTTGMIDVTSGGGTIPFDYQWSSGENTEDITNIGAGTYVLTITDAGSCTTEDTYIVSEPSDSLQISGSTNDVLCYGGNDGEITTTITGGTSGYSFLWSSGQSSQNLSNITAGDYTLTVTDANTCTATDSFTVTQPIQMEFTYYDTDDVLCHGDTTGSISVDVSGGAGNLTYEWHKSGMPGVFSTNEDISSLGTGTYSLTVTDTNACYIDTSAVINEPPPLDNNFNITPITCQGYNDGIIEANPTGGSGIYISYHWTYENNPNIIGVDSVLTGCQPGTYYVEIKDSHYCIKYDSVEITDPPAHTVQLTETDMSCHGAHNGEIEVIVDNGTTSGLTYNWSNGAGNVATATGLGPGSYTVTITDSLGCDMIETGSITEPPLGELGELPASGNAWLCTGNNLTLDAGSGYASYTWNTGATSQSITVNTTGVYHVFVVATDSCEYGDTVEVEIAEPYEDEEICLASVTDSNYVELIWNKTPNQGTSGYNIYRENPSTSNFDLITTVPYSSPGYYLDNSVDASSDDQNYKLSVVDTCGNESVKSEMHSTIKLDVTADVNGACHLDWDSYEGYFVVYYYIRRGTTPNNLQLVDSVLYTHFDYAEMNPDPNGVYYQIMVKQPNPCNPGNGNTYNRAYSNIMYCDNLVGIPSNIYGHIDVYPNPFDEKIIVDLYLKLKADVKVSLYNTMGQKVFEEEYGKINVGEHNFEISDSSLKPGLYHLSINFGNEVYGEEIIKR